MVERASRSGTSSGERRRKLTRILVVELRNGGRKHLRKGGREGCGKSRGRTVPWLRLVPSDLDLLIEIARLSAPARPPHGSEGVGQGRVLHTGGPSWTRLGSALKAKTAPAPHLGLGNFQVGVCRDSRLRPPPPPPNHNPQPTKHQHHTGQENEKEDTMAQPPIATYVSLHSDTYKACPPP